MRRYVLVVVGILLVGLVVLAVRLGRDPVAQESDILEVEAGAPLPAAAVTEPAPAVSVEPAPAVTPTEDAPAPAEPAMYIAGRVTDVDGTGVMDVMMVAASDTDSSPIPRDVYGNYDYHETDAEGSFRLPIRSPGTYEVTAVPDFSVRKLSSVRNVSTEVTVPSGGGVDGVTLQLDVRMGPLLRGVLLTHDGLPVPDETVYFETRVTGGLSMTTQRTDAKGRFSLSGLPASSLGDMRAHHPRFGDVYEKGVSPDAQDMELRFPEPVTLAGQVVNRAGDPVTRFEVLTVSWETAEPSDLLTVADPEGRFSLSDLQFGSITIMAEGYSPAKVPVRTASGAPREEVSVRLSDAVVIYGYVRDPDGEPWFNARVYPEDRQHIYDTFSAQFTATTDANGYYELRGAPTWHLTLYAEAAGAPRDRTRNFQPPKSGSVQVDFEVERGGVINGEVRYDKSLGTPKVTINTYPRRSDVRSFGSIQTEFFSGGSGASMSQDVVDGRFRFDALPANGYNVIVSVVQNRKGRELEHFVTLGSGETQNVLFDFEAEGVGAVNGVVFEGDVPVANADVVLVSAGPGGRQDFEAESASDGGFTVEGVPAGAVYLYVSGKDIDGTRFAWAYPFVVTDGEAVDVSVDLGQTGAVTVHGPAEGNLLTEVRAFFDGVDVTQLHMADGLPIGLAAKARQASPRRFEFKGLNPGRYVIQATPGLANRQPIVVDVVAGEEITVSF